MRQSILIADSFSNKAKQLREHFEQRFENPLSAEAGRFVWDYWHVPGQYTTLRTPAYHFFPPKLYQAFHRELVLWGRENLGCHDISPPWLSCYVDGCRQDFHSDLPHGPWAFVYSLTPWKKRKFTGGETFMLQEEMLELWKNLDSFKGLEENRILKTIDPEFNRLTVFDPRIPHGVKRVEGVSDPREGRLVVHGWFMQPRPFIEGKLSRKSLELAIGILSAEIGPFLSKRSALRGILSLRFRVETSGRIRSVRELSNTLVSIEGDPELPQDLVSFVKKKLAQIAFPKQSAHSNVTLPLVFEA